jgi:hypothetical protein
VRVEKGFSPAIQRYFMAALAAGSKLFLKTLGVKALLDLTFNAALKRCSTLFLPCLRIPPQ